MTENRALTSGLLTSSLQAGEAELVGCTSETKQISAGPYPGLSYFPATELISPLLYGNAALAGRGVGEDEDVAAHA